MAEVSYLHLHEEDDDNLDSIPYWSHHDFETSFDLHSSDDLDDFPPSSDFTLRPQIITVDNHHHHHHLPNRHRVSDDDDDDDDFPMSDSIRNVGHLFDRENQVNFVMDLFHQRVEQSSSRVVVNDSDLVFSDPSFGDLEGNEEMNNLDLDLGLGLGFCMNRHDLHDENDNSGLRVIGIESDSDQGESEIVGIDLNEDDDYGLDNAGDDEIGLPLRWDSFHLDDHRDGSGDFEWEEVDGRVDEREVLSMFFDGDGDEDLDASVSAVIPSEESGVERVGELGNLEWEVLLDVQNLNLNPESELAGMPYFGEHDEYNNATEYEMLFGQFAENENSHLGRPPASKTVVKNLLSIVLTPKDAENNNALCAVCKDEMNIAEKAKQLPCSHRYHGDCIVPWLNIRNTCPVCRYELPTDDPDYERRRAQRADRAR